MSTRHGTGVQVIHFKFLLILADKGVGMAFTISRIEEEGARLGIKVPDKTLIHAHLDEMAAAGWLERVDQTMWKMTFNGSQAIRILFHGKDRIDPANPSFAKNWGSKVVQCFKAAKLNSTQAYAMSGFRDVNSWNRLWNTEPGTVNKIAKKTPKAQKIINVLLDKADGLGQAKTIWDIHQALEGRKLDRNNWNETEDKKLNSTIETVRLMVNSNLVTRTKTAAKGKGSDGIMLPDTQENREKLAAFQAVLTEHPIADLFDQAANTALSMKAPVPVAPATSVQVGPGTALGITPTEADPPKVGYKMTVERLLILDTIHACKSIVPSTIQLHGYQIEPLEAAKVKAHIQALVQMGLADDNGTTERGALIVDSLFGNDGIPRELLVMADNPWVVIVKHLHVVRKLTSRDAMVRATGLSQTTIRDALKAAGLLDVVDHHDPAPIATLGAPVPATENAPLAAVHELPVTATYPAWATKDPVVLANLQRQAAFKDMDPVAYAWHINEIAGPAEIMRRAADIEARLKQCG